MKKTICAALLLAAGLAHAQALPDNAELAALHNADQADRGGAVDWQVVARRDKQRRQQVSAMLAAGALRTARDYYHAALVFQHGQTPDDYALAFALATIARKLAPDLAAPKWLSAAAFDRYLVSRKMPQWYGTQSAIPFDTNVETLEPVDPKAVSDEERVALGVPRLQDKLADIAERNKQRQAK